MGDLTELNEKVYNDTEVQHPDQQLEEQVGEESTFSIGFLITKFSLSPKLPKKMQRDFIPGRR